MKVISVAFVIAALAPAVPAAAQTYPPRACPLTAARSVVAPGDSLLIRGTCASPGAEVRLTFQPPGTVLATVVADAQGAFSATVVIPPDASAGIHAIIATMGSQVLGTIEVNVLAPLAAPPDEPGEGIPAWILVAAAAAVVAGGVALVVRARRRRFYDDIDA